MKPEDLTFATLFERLPVYKYPASQLITGPHDPRDVYYIHNGYAKGYEITADGEAQLISYHGPGEVFPFYWALKGTDLSLFFEALSPLHISRMPQPDFSRAVYNDIELLRQTNQFLLKMYRYHQLRIQNLEFPSAAERVAFRLNFLAEYHSHADEQKVVIDVPLIYKDIADAVGLTRDTVGRVMSDFIKQKLLTRRGKQIVIVDRDRLTSIYL